MIGCDALARVYPPDLVDALRAEAGLDPTPLSADDLRGDRQLIACEIWSGSCWTWYEYTDEGLFIIVTVPDPDPAALENGTSITFNCCCSNLQTEETEDGTISVELPPMKPGIRKEKDSSAP